METLTCEVCDQDWQRKTARGRKPKNCPDCKAGKNLSDARAPASSVKPVKKTTLPPGTARNKNIDPAVKARKLSARSSGWCTDYNMGPVAQHWRCDADLGNVQCCCECHR